MLVTDKKEDKPEKEWENPQAPEKTGDDRDKEQLIRQFKEAKRRHDNLTETDEDNTETEEKH